MYVPNLSEESNTIYKDIKDKPYFLLAKISLSAGKQTKPSKTSSWAFLHTTFLFKGHRWVCYSSQVTSMRAKIDNMRSKGLTSNPTVVSCKTGQICFSMTRLF